jgi:Leucine-rich repeat (LRR) protein
VQDHGADLSLQEICLRQNQITKIAFPSNLGSTLESLDLYDNLIGHINGLDEFTQLNNLDLSFNKIKHIKNVGHLRKLQNLYFVQNKIQTIEGLEGLSELRNLELAANRIRVKNYNLLEMCMG